MTEIEELKDKISKLISELIAIYSQYCDMFQKKIFPNKDTVSLWVKQIQPQYTDFDDKLLKVEKNIALIPYITEQYYKYTETFQSSNDTSISYLKLLFNTLNETGQIRQLPNFITPLNDSFDKVKSDDLNYDTKNTNEYFKSHLLENQETVDLLKGKLVELESLKDLNVDTLISERKAELQKIINERDYENGIKKYNNKGLIGTVPICIYKEYKDRIFTLLDQEPEVLDAFRKKHFSHIPQELQRTTLY